MASDRSSYRSSGQEYIREGEMARPLLFEHPNNSQSHQTHLTERYQERSNARHQFSSSSSIETNTRHFDRTATCSKAHSLLSSQGYTKLSGSQVGILKNKILATLSTRCLPTPRLLSAKLCSLHRRWSSSLWSSPPSHCSSVFSASFAHLTPASSP